MSASEETCKTARPISYYRKPERLKLLAQRQHQATRGNGRSESSLEEEQVTMLGVGADSIRENAER